MTEQELLRAVTELITECKLKDKRIIDMEYKITNLEYLVRSLSDSLKMKNAWHEFDADGRC
jgi:hypothetical protein